MAMVKPARETYGSINVTRVRLKRQRGGKLGYVGQYAAFVLTSFFYLASRSLTRRYDLVHVHNMPDVLVFGAIVPKLLGAKIILDLHDPMPELMQTIFKLPEDSFSVRRVEATGEVEYPLCGSRADSESRMQEDLLFAQLSAG